jgi:hypothetical protein
MEKALTDKTLQVIEAISEMEFAKSYYLVGGTALSLQLHHRLSEDLDFMRWQRVKNEKTEIPLAEIKRELSGCLCIDAVNILNFNQITMLIEGGVKLSFYAPLKRQPTIQPVRYLNNLVLADVDCIAALKMETMLRRNEYRDYYDLYCILKDKSPDAIKSIINNALRYSEHNLKSKNLIGMLTNPDRFVPSASFAALHPVLTITPQEIAAFMVEKLQCYK